MSAPFFLPDHPATQAFLDYLWALGQDQARTAQEVPGKKLRPGVISAAAACIPFNEGDL